MDLQPQGWETFTDFMQTPPHLNLQGKGIFELNSQHRYDPTKVTNGWYGNRPTDHDYRDAAKNQASHPFTLRLQVPNDVSEPVWP